MTALNIIVIVNYPFEKHYILASLVKGRWIDGKAQVLILLLSACDMPTIFMLQTFCRQDGGIASSPPPRLTTPLPKPHHPLLYTITLASLVKGEVLSPEKIRATTEGIVTPSPLPKPHYHPRFSFCNRLCVLIRFCI